jgi:hypothetical protein
MKSTLLITVLFVSILIVSCSSFKPESKEFEIAKQNGELANEAFVRSLKFVNGWLPYRDSVSGLIPANLNKSKDFWEPHNSAADNYSFMVLTAYLLDKDLYNGPMLDILHAERKLTSRIKSLPDTYSFSKKNFKTEKPDMYWVIFGTAEYMKDGIIPLCEYIGKSPWSERMMEMLNDLPEYYTLFKDIDQLGGYKAASEEVNGDMLQTLTRVYWMTGDEKFLDWAIKIGDYYMLGERDLDKLQYLRLRDHGCEIIGGLSELYVALNFVHPEKKKLYQEPLHRLLDRVLEVGRNSDGLFYNAINPATGEITDKKIADNWGYIFDAFYSVYLIDKKEEYRQAFLSMINNLNEKYRNYPWEGKSHDGYADAIESGINLYNREEVPQLKEWIDSEIKVMWKIQREDGIVEGWHGDGNFARTSIMYGLWKTQGTNLQPWRNDLKIGAEMKNGKLYLALSADQEWQGKLVFDFKRHAENMHFPIDYPRINQFPEWFTIDSGKSYSVVSTDSAIKGLIAGKDLLNGLPVVINPGEKLLIQVEEKASEKSN